MSHHPDKRRKRSRCPNCHHFSDYKRRSGGSRPHRCANKEGSGKRRSGKEVQANVKVIGKQSRGAA